MDDINSNFLTKYLRNRELGSKVKSGTSDKFMDKLYTHLVPCAFWDDNDGLGNSAPGGIFNLEFSPDGSLLVAACENRSVLLFDPICRQLVNSVDNAHFDCVNCVRFLDSRVFATCSDDSTVALWDARNLKSRIRTLYGHSNWVKNIEYSQSDGLLVTSGFDGVIFTWDINSYTERGFVYDRVFHTNGLMRTRLNPDASKMIICTTGGFLMVIHDLNLRTLARDLSGFKPNMYRLMQLSQTTIPVAASYTHLFSPKRKQNRVEFVTDFPDGDDAEVVSSLQIHPQGWCALSRNISNDESSEWTCVHDIQEPAMRKRRQRLRKSSSFGNRIGNKRSNMEGSSSDEASEDEDDTDDSDRSSASSRILSSPLSPPLTVAAAVQTGESFADRVTGVGRGRRGLQRQNAFRGLRGGSSSLAVSSPEITLSSTDVWEALLAIREARARRTARHQQYHQHLGSLANGNGAAAAPIPGGNAAANADAAPSNNQPNDHPDRREIDSRLRIIRMQSGFDGSHHALVHPERRRLFRRGHGPGASWSRGSLSSDLDPMVVVERLSSRLLPPPPPPPPPPPRTVPPNHRIHKNIPRLTHYIMESNVGKGFIKELCFSSDGRLICSPFGYGVRLLTFSPGCRELCDCVPSNGPVQLYQISTSVSHPDIVVSTKFSPTHCLLVSGCLTGRIVWHQPVL